MEDYGGEVIAFDLAPEVIEGRLDPDRVVVMRFSSRERFRAFFDSPEYQAALAIAADGGSRSKSIVVDELWSLAPRHL